MYCASASTMYTGRSALLRQPPTPLGSTRPVHRRLRRTAWWARTRGGGERRQARPRIFSRRTAHVTSWLGGLNYPGDEPGEGVSPRPIVSPSDETDETSDTTISCDTTPHSFRGRAKPERIARCPHTRGRAGQVQAEASIRRHAAGISPMRGPLSACMRVCALTASSCADASTLTLTCAPTALSGGATVLGACSDAFTTSEP